MWTLATLRLANRYHAGVAAAVGLASMAFWPDGTLGIFCGAGVMWANLAGACLVSRRSMQGRSPLATVGGWLMAKLVLLLAAVATLMWFEIVHPLGIVAGMACFFVGVGLAMAQSGWRPAASAG